MPHMIRLALSDVLFCTVPFYICFYTYIVYLVPAICEDQQGGLHDWFRLESNKEGRKCVGWGRGVCVGVSVQLQVEASVRTWE